MARFFGFGRQRADLEVPAAPVPEVPTPLVVPEVNQRVTILRAGTPPLPSRVEDVTDEEVVIASPNVAMHVGDVVSISWEADTGWYSMETVVTVVDEESRIPMIAVSSRGRVARHDDRRVHARCLAEVDLTVRPITARILKPGQQLKTATLEVGGNALRFASSAPFAPGDVAESELAIGFGDPVRVRLKVIRVDAKTDSLKQICTAVYDEILRSDRSRLIAWIENTNDVVAATEAAQVEATIDALPTVTPGLDEPSLSPFPEQQEPSRYTTAHDDV